MILCKEKRVDLYTGNDDIPSVRIGNDLLQISPEELDTCEEAKELLYWDAKYYTWGEFSE